MQRTDLVTARSSDVARAGYDATTRGAGVVVPGMKNELLAQSVAAGSIAPGDEAGENAKTFQGGGSSSASLGWADGLDPRPPA